jgi:uncharacterized membrane protein YidH (DUF202 family)
MAAEATVQYVSNEEYRMLLQLETSLLGWLRTSLSLIGFGFGIARFGLFLREIAVANQLVVHPHPWSFTSPLRVPPSVPAWPAP